MNWTRIRSRRAFAGAYLACFVAVESGYTRLDPAAQARLITWASTDVANLEHEPAGPLLVSALVAPGCFVAADRYLTDAGPSYVVVSAVVIALACGTWLARALAAPDLAAPDLAVLVFAGDIFGGQPATWPLPTAMPIR